MPRIARIVGVGYPHHIVQRGNNREKVFFDHDDYKKYLSLLAKYSEKKKASIIAYCLMPNHVHLLIRPSEEGALGKMMQGITLCYTQYFNRKKGRTGRLWECRYHSSVIDRDRYLWAVSKYIEKNPIRAEIVKRPEDYTYSSAKAHILGRQNPLLKEPLFDNNELNEYRKLMKTEENTQVIEEIRKKTMLGKPLGDASFLKILSERLGCSLSFRPKGRPRRTK
jgi:putative transposase